jgi:hypothetical protein
MLQQLLSRLRASIQLPECLRVMGYLRRIAAFTEPELRLQFLQVGVHVRVGHTWALSRGGRCQVSSSVSDPGLQVIGCVYTSCTQEWASRR